mmetsp:Transcript_88094/g.172318  ORF Transcript_88094/g.172318 Transcript_88094/m.172318 type:complete len:232 (-) Transcript_88094:401-1096(-)
MRLDEDERGVQRVKVGKRNDLVQAVGRIQILELVENGALLAANELHLRVHGPRLDLSLRHPCLQQRLAEDVLADRGPEPIRALRQALERRGRGMHAVVAHVRHRLQAQLLPLGQDLPAQRVRRSLRRVRRAQHLAAEVRPRQRRRVPLHRVVVDLRARLRELRAHGHEEAVEGIDLGLALNLDGATVESTAELHLVSLVPKSIETVSINTQELAGTHGIVDKAVGKSSLPR